MTPENVVKEAVKTQSNLKLGRVRSGIHYICVNCLFRVYKMFSG